MSANWPAFTSKRFAMVPHNPRENDYYGPYNGLLHFLFPPDTPFTVGPQFYVVQRPLEGCIRIIEYEVTYRNTPVLLFKMGSESAIDLASAREEADTRIRTRLKDLADQHPLSRLYAVSTFGTRACFYTAERGQPIVPHIVQDPQSENDTAPISRWDCDILDAVGAARLKAIAEELQGDCAKLPYDSFLLK